MDKGQDNEAMGCLAAIGVALLCMAAGLVVGHFFGMAVGAATCLGLMALWLFFTVVAAKGRGER